LFWVSTARYEGKKGVELFTNNKKLKEQLVKIVSVGGLVNTDTSIHVFFMSLIVDP